MKISKPVTLNNLHSESVNNDSLDNLPCNSNSIKPDFSSNYIPAYSYRSNYVAFLGMREYQLDSTLANKRPIMHVTPENVPEDNLMEQEVKKLVKKYQESNSEETFEKLYDQYKKLIFQIARKVKYKNNLDLDDLVQEGKIGLLEAIQNANPNSNVKFVSYAYPYIKGNMLKARRHGNLIKFPRPLMDSEIGFNRTINKLTKELGREPSLEELSRETKLSLEDCRGLKDFINGNLSLEETIGNTENTYDNLLLINNETPEKKYLQDTELRVLNDIIERNIPDNMELYIIKMQYLSNLSPGEVSKVLGISENKVLFYTINAFKKIINDPQYSEIKTPFEIKQLKKMIQKYELNNCLESFNKTVPEFNIIPQLLAQKNEKNPTLEEIKTEIKTILDKANLTDRQRQTIELLSGLSENKAENLYEVGETLGVSEKNVASYIVAARNKIEKILKEDYKIEKYKTPTVYEIMSFSKNREGILEQLSLNEREEAILSSLTDDNGLFRRPSEISEKTGLFASNIVKYTGEVQKKLLEVIKQNSSFALKNSSYEEIKKPENFLIFLKSLTEAQRNTIGMLLSCNTPTGTINTFQISKSTIESNVKGALNNWKKYFPNYYENLERVVKNPQEFDKKDSKIVLKDLMKLSEDLANKLKKIKI